MHLRSSTLFFFSTLSLAAPACGPDRGTSETDGDPSPGSSSTAEPTTAPATTSTDGSTGAPGSGSTSGESTGSPDTSSTAGSSTGDPPLGSCETRLTQEDCLATEIGGHNDCAWQPEFAQWSDQGGCGTFAGPPRCLPVHYAGDGCGFSDCPTFDRIYVRDLGGGAFELMDYMGGCGLEPDGWSQCFNTVDDPPACKCFC